MSKSNSYLLDVNVLLALSTSRHQHHLKAARFPDEAGEGQLRLCRVAQMGLLRLLTNKVVQAEDVLSGKQAWTLFDSLLRDSRFRYVDEPRGIDSAWRKLSALPDWGQSRWTDDYLLSFAKLSDLRLLTFDTGVLRRADGGNAQVI